MLQAADGSIVGALEPFTVPQPWWPEVADVVEEARRQRAIDVTVLRILHARPDPEDPSGMGGDVTYVAELHGAAPRDLRAPDPRVAAEALEEQPLRLPFARLGGPARELAWAQQMLAARARPQTGPARQIRTCNLSGIWSIPTAAGTVWLKSVPPFFAHEGAVIEFLSDPALPTLVAAARGRMVTEEIPGIDLYDAPLAMLERAVSTLVALQDRVADRIDELFALGLPDWRWPAFEPRMRDVIARHGYELDGPERAALDRLVEGFDARCAAIDACGLPMTLVHGDFHPGNLRGDGRQLTLLDWGDSGVGHPLFDLPAMVERIEPSSRDEFVARWARAWQERRPDADPVRAARLVEPLAGIRQALIYRHFLDHIEPSEHRYHERDPGRWLRRVAASGKTISLD